MAIARRLGGRLEPLVFTLSAAAPVVREQGFPVEFCASYRTPGAGTEWRWSRRLRGRARAAIADETPALVVFDGAHPYLGFLDAQRAERPRAVWSRRAMWKPGANRAALPRPAANYAAFDLVVAAAGYNGFHELLELGVPALFVPIERETDDQAARAAWAANAGLAGAVAAPSAPELERELDRLLDPGERGRISQRL